MVYRVNRDPIIDNNRTLRVDRMRVGSFSKRFFFQGSTSGYVSGGNGAGPYNVQNIIQKFPFATFVQSSNIADLTQSRNYGSGQSSEDNGYTSGGQISPEGTVTNVIDKFPFSSNDNATDVGDLTVAKGGAAGQSTGSNGYVTGGTAPPGGGNSPADAINTIEKFPFSSDANATDVGDLTAVKSTNAGQSSETHGYTSGGVPFYFYNPNQLNIIDKFPFATDANATDVGDLTVARGKTAGQSSTTHGYTSAGGSGGGAQTVNNIIDKFAFAADANASDVGDLTVARYGVSGQSSTTSGYTSGGQQSGNTIDKFPFSSDANATSAGSLFNGLEATTGQQV